MSDEPELDLSSFPKPASPVYLGLDILLLTLRQLIKKGLLKPRDEFQTKVFCKVLRANNFLDHFGEANATESRRINRVGELLGGSGLGLKQPQRARLRGWFVVPDKLPVLRNGVVAKAAVYRGLGESI